MKLTSILLSAIIIFPLICGTRVNADTLTDRLSSLRTYLYTNGSTASYLGENYVGITSVYPDKQNAYLAIYVSESDSKIYFSSLIDVNRPTKSGLTFSIDATTGLIDNSKIYWHKVTSGRIVATYSSAFSYSFDCSSSSLDFTREARSETVADIESVLEDQTVEIMPEFDAILQRHGFSLGYIGFTNSLFNHAAIKQCLVGSLNHISTLTCTYLSYDYATRDSVYYRVFKSGNVISSGTLDYAHVADTGSRIPIYGYKLTLSVNDTSVFADNGVFPADGYAVCLYENGQTIWSTYFSITNVTSSGVPTPTSNVTHRVSATPTVEATRPSPTGGSSFRPTSGATATPTGGATRPSPTGGSSIRPTSAPSLPPFNAEAGGTGVQGFVSRLYSVVMNREGDASGIDFWVNDLTAKRITGGDAAKLFLLSEEFRNKGYSDEQFVEILYRLFFNRTGVDDPDGMNYWVSCLENKATKEDVINGFINSSEWATICASYGIASGGTGAVIIPPVLTEFVTSLYTTCLEREAEQSGVNYWTTILFSHSLTGSDAAREFFFGVEFVNQNVSDEVYVRRLYRTFLGRECSASELDYWINFLSSNARQAVFNGFSASEEFASRCRIAGINP